MGDRLAGRIAIISGGASGCGEAASRLFAAEGATVAIIDLQADLAASVAASIVADGGVAVSAGLMFLTAPKWLLLLHP
jgi:NAD(P)-dependent dehydrogenase (short-subunit alcohol dehydrogenase family)